MRYAEARELLEENAQNGDVLKMLGEVGLNTSVKVVVRAGNSDPFVADGAVVFVSEAYGDKKVGVLFSGGSHYSELPFDYPCLVPRIGADPKEIKADFRRFQEFMNLLHRSKKGSL